MPSESPYLYYARRSWFAPMEETIWDLVEAPGTAPGSATLIPYYVYRHIPPTEADGPLQYSDSKPDLEGRHGRARSF